MSDHGQAEEIQKIQEWWEAKGLRLQFHEDEGIIWADLFSIRKGEVFWPKYGSGDSELAAAKRSVERHHQEE